MTVLIFDHVQTIVEMTYHVFVCEQNKFCMDYE